MRTIKQHLFELLLLVVGLSFAVFLGCMVNPQEASAKALYQAEFSTSVSTTTATFSPSPGTYSVSLVFSGSAVGTVYLERANPSIGITTYQVVLPYTGPIETTLLHGGGKDWIYRFRAVLTAGTVSATMLQDKGDQGSSSSTF